jgi:hypothetical protein
MVAAVTKDSYSFSADTAAGVLSHSVVVRKQKLPPLPMLVRIQAWAHSHLDKPSSPLLDDSTSAVPTHARTSARSRRTATHTPRSPGAGGPAPSSWWNDSGWSTDGSVQMDPLSRAVQGPSWAPSARSVAASRRLPTTGEEGEGDGGGDAEEGRGGGPPVQRNGKLEDVD